ncbi:amino acid adenylation domain-containing protein [Streptomyces sp. BR123]|uniref:non-ribosomal peptide synthetase n=1 Tax=Streptomyces sp. BR123 TaxID=2749828 RepID=UPI0015C4131F|nr:amino acid adenylation domain-containing protein [Streptomyces sp. BR123]NXY97490.1 amino acid adenylation domain-containing protein [Streptomyces sp. BR123]
MAVHLEGGRDFWHRVLLSGGSTTLPRWTHAPAAGVATHEEPVPEEVAAGLRRRASELAVPLTTLLLAAHARVLAALSGEREVTAGYVAAPGDPVLPCRLDTAPESWRGLVAEVHGVESALREHGGYPVEALRRETGLPGPSYETVFDSSGEGGVGTAPAATRSACGPEPAEQAVLVVGAAHAPGRLVLRLRYRTEALDPDSARRIAGYHCTALALLAADPDAAHHPQSLLSAEEVHFQLEELAGPRRDLPDRRAHELFEERVRMHPQAVAVVHGARSWTYREVNERANRLGRALLARGLRSEDPVAVVTERTPEWLTAVLAVFKAGGVYLPIEPHFPAGRIAATLERARCRLVLTTADSTATLEPAAATLPGTTVLCLDTALAEQTDGRDLGVAVAGDQLAYIYFTSGSTGTPKGAMCEHAGMLNHLRAKIDDLGVTDSAVVAQIAPQCFDISLWQLVSALLVGGRTLLVEQDVILDAERFLDRIVEGRVSVLQVVPSYLEVVMTCLERRPRALPDLRCVSVTGEPLKKELTERWFAAQPDIPLVNAYGLTETSDDTNHEVMHGVPRQERVPLGRPIANVHVYVVDEHLRPVPLGAPGEIVFSGVCVGRGYVNDPERTAAAFLDDPHRPGRRLYRSGDHGRWLPDGKLEFLGRRDTQVKIRGFRIEIGEIENTLLRVPGVRDGAVVVTDRGDRGKHLVAFYSGPQELDPERLREQLGASLPGYMVPPVFQWRESLPLTANGKTDRKALTALATELADLADAGGTGEGYAVPATPTEHRLATAWAEVLGVPQDRVGRMDHFFDRGGTSLAAVRLAIALDRAVSLKDVTRCPVLADLAALVDERSGQTPAGPPAGEGGPLGARAAGIAGGVLLQTLSRPADSRAGALVCIPPAGGNAVNFLPLAQALPGGGPAVHAVELPGHDPAATGAEPLAPLSEVAVQVADDIRRQGMSGVLLWGHSSGAALAVAVARLLEEAGTPARHLFIGAQLLGSATERRSAAAELEQQSDAVIAARLTAGGSGGTPAPGARQAERTAAAYRHDCVSAHHYFADLVQSPPADRLATAVTVVVAADDPYTAGAALRHRDWGVLARRVELYELTDGGHHFPRTRPLETAKAVLHATQ